jgi:hypothetical protein
MVIMIFKISASHSSFSSTEFSEVIGEEHFLNNGEAPRTG